MHGPLYTPPSEQGTLFLPGVFGGANWGGGGVDPDTGILYVPSRMTPVVSRLGPADPKAANFRHQGGAGTQPHPTPIPGLFVFKPPYPKITAIHINKGHS